MFPNIQCFLMMLPWPCNGATRKSKSKIKLQDILARAMIFIKIQCFLLLLEMIRQQ